MGFDIYGMNPQLNEEYPPRFEEIIKEYGTADGYLDWKKEIPEEIRDEYHSLKDGFNDDNPGTYFRNNVWFWRPLWNFVCDTCGDFLTDKDMGGGDTNDGYVISKTKAQKIAAKLREAIDSGVCERIEKDYKKKAEEARKHNVKIEAELEQINADCKAKHGNLVPREYPEPYKTQWNDAYSRKSWTDSYPFSVENIKNFANFCEQSGGFEIC